LIGSIILYSLVLLSNYWQKFTISLAIGLEAVTIGVMALLIPAAQNIVVAKADEQFSVRVAEHITDIFTTSFVVVLLIACYDIWKYVKIYRELR